MVVYFSLSAQAGAQSGFNGTWSEVLAYFSGCSSQYGYDPENSAHIAENSLGNGELKWRDCAYAGLEKIMIPKSSTPDLFRQLIAEDKSLTAKLGKGEITRSHRKSRISEILQEIHQRENQSYKADRKRMHDEMRRFERSRNPAARRAVRGWL